MLILGLATLAIVSISNPQSQNCSPKSNTGCEKQAENHLSFVQRTIDDPVSLFTFFLVAVGTGQLGLFWWQLAILNRSVKDATLSANAAQRSADTAERALTVLERPFVYCFVSKPGITTGLGISQGPGQPVKWSISVDELELSVNNVGRTPAQLTRFYATIKIVNHPGICDPVDRSIEGGMELPVGTVCLQKTDFKHKINLRGFIRNKKDIVDIESQTTAPWVIGYVRYDDIFGTHHINGFALTFDIQSKSYVRRGGAQYNYEATEKDNEIPLFPSSLA